MEYINSEISLGIIVDMETALKWLRSTFLYVAMNKERQQYGIGDKVSINAYFSNIVHQTIQSLVANELIVVNENGKFVSTSYGRTMSRCSLKLETVSNLKQLPFGSSVSRIVRVIINALVHTFCSFKHSLKLQSSGMSSSPQVTKGSSMRL